MNAPHRMSSAPERYRLSVENFLLLNDAGGFSDFAKVELIDGDIYVMNAQYHPHAHAKTQLTIALGIRLKEIGTPLLIASEVSVRLNADTLPEPDIVLVRSGGKGPVPVESVVLAIEVSDTTLDVDLGRKAELYAAAGIPEYWVVDLNENRVLMHEHPDADGYQEQVDVPFGERLVSATIEGLSVESANLVL